MKKSRAAASSLSYTGLLSGVVELLEQARRTSVRSINSIMTATYWEIGRRIVEFEQGGRSKPAYGEELIDRLADDLRARFGKGFSRSNVFQMRQFYLAYRQKVQTASGQSVRQKIQTASGFPLPTFPLPWSHYVHLLSVEKPETRAFYETEALRGGWSVRQLDRQISTLFYERTLLSRNKAAMLKKGGRVRPGEKLTPEEEIKDPKVLAAEYKTVLPNERELVEELRRTQMVLGSRIASRQLPERRIKDE